ncbi:hypothetical protein ACFYKX_17400 [Cytobacillus sp. FJAT-54145]|uniref:Spore coat protein n=1 Tax=Cytobacillus spartinae TaxID=3299023 RepID=A0ABW6KDX2_9BACI
MYPYYPNHPNMNYYPQAQHMPPNYTYNPYNAQMPHYRFYPQPYYRPFPQVNPDLFMQSAHHMQVLMKDASLLLDRMASSKEYAMNLMGAAQESKMQQVNDMIKGAGITTMPEVSYTPEGLKLYFKSKAEDIDCCHLSLTLRWM